MYWILGFIVAWTILIGIAGITLGRTGEVAVVFRFGTFYRVLLPRTFPYFTIPLIDRIERYSTQVHQHELPDEPENIDRLNDIALPGKKLPFRIPHKGMAEAVFYVRKDYDVSTRTGDPFDSSRSMGELKRVRFSELPDAVQTAMQEDSLNAPLTSEAAAVFEWHLKGDTINAVQDFIQNVSPEEGRSREEEVRKRAEDMITRTLQEYLAPTTLGHAIEMAPLFNRLIKERLEVLVGESGAGVAGSSDRPWGIRVGESYLKPIHPGHTINDARAKAGATISNKFGTIRDAEAKAGATRVQADADAYAEQRKGEGEAARIGAMAAVMRDPNAILIAQLDVAEQVLPKANLVIMPSDLGVIGGILALGGEIAKKKQGGEPEKK